MENSYFTVATTQGKQGIWMLTFPDRENTGNLHNLIPTQGKYLQHRENSGKTQGMSVATLYFFHCSYLSPTLWNQSIFGLISLPFIKTRLPCKRNSSPAKTCTDSWPLVAYLDTYVRAQWICTFLLRNRIVMFPIMPEFTFLSAPILCTQCFYLM